MYSGTTRCCWCPRMVPSGASPWEGVSPCLLQELAWSSLVWMQCSGLHTDTSRVVCESGGAAPTW